MLVANQGNATSSLLFCQPTLSCISWDFSVVKCCCTVLSGACLPGERNSWLLPPPVDQVSTISLLQSIQCSGEDDIGVASTQLHVWVKVTSFFLSYVPPNSVISFGLSAHLWAEFSVEFSFSSIFSLWDCRFVLPMATPSQGVLLIGCKLQKQI